MNNNVYKGDIQPNHREYSVWVDSKGLIKTFDGNEWKVASGGGIPIVEKLDPNAPIGSVVCYKQTVTIDKEAIKTGSIRELKYSTFESWPTDVDTHGLPIITDIQFLEHPEPLLDGCAEMLIYDGESVISIYTGEGGICGFVNYDEKISLEDIKIPKSGLYYLGLFIDTDGDYLPVEEQFDIFDKILLDFQDPQDL